MLNLYLKIGIPILVHGLKKREYNELAISDVYKRILLSLRHVLYCYMHTL